MSIPPNNKYTILSDKDYMAQRAKQYAKILTLYTAEAFPDIVVGYIPLYTVTHYEFASSQDILRYRAVGAQYLAHQAGGNFSLRVDCILRNPTALMYLSMLQALYMYGQKTEDKFNNVMGEFKLFDIASSKLKQKNSIVVSAEDKSKLFSENVEKVPTTDLGWLKHMKHETFTVLTKENVLFDMYIESIIYYQNMEGDKDTIFVSLLFRKFEPNPTIQSTALYEVREKEAEKLNKAKLEYGLAADDKLEDSSKNIPVQITQSITSRYNFYRKRYPNKSPYIDIMFSQMHSSLTGGISIATSRIELYKSRSVRDTGVIGNLFKLRSKQVIQEVPKITARINSVKTTYSAILISPPLRTTDLVLDKMSLISGIGGNISKNMSELYQRLNTDFSYKVYSSDGTAYSLIIYDNSRQKVYINTPVQKNQYYGFIINKNKYLYILREKNQYEFYSYFGEFT
jgi:hypothetical protein